jgi:heterogeneous nuclear ribonucleoprotein G
VNDDSLAEIFSEAGEVTEAKVIFDKFSGRSKGFGFVTLVDEDTAQKAIDAMNGKEVDGRKITVNLSRPKEPRESR